MAIYAYGSREKELKREMKFLPDMVYIDLKKEETRDQEMVQNLLKKYHKALKFIFVKYANTGNFEKYISRFQYQGSPHYVENL